VNLVQPHQASYMNNHPAVCDHRTQSSFSSLDGGDLITYPILRSLQVCEMHLGMLNFLKLYLNQNNTSSILEPEPEAPTLAI